MASGSIKKDAVLLWTNPSPTSSFAAQTISLDLSGYAFVYVVANYMYSGNRLTYSVARVDGSTYYLFEMGGIDGQYLAFLTRIMTVSSTGIEFGNSYRRTSMSSSASSATSDYLVPLRIYGIRSE